MGEYVKNDYEEDLNMLAVKIPKKETIIVVEENIPTPGDGEVLIKMKASALCRSDLHRFHGNNLFEDSDDADITPGHEPCGIVESVGENVKNVKVGDRVAIYLGLGCGTCEHCLAGDTILCKEFKCIGFDKNGAHADYMTIPEENCLPLPDEMSFIEGALSTDVAGTLYTACKTLNLNGSKTVAIFGVGPMGSGGVLIAKGFGATVIAVDINEERLKLAKELGADYTINPTEENSVEAIKRITGGKGADAAINTAGGNIIVNDALNCIKSRGKVALIAESNSATIDPSNQFIRKLAQLVGCWYFNKSDWEEITEFLIRKKIPLEKISSCTYDIKDAEEAFRLFDSGKTQKVVFTWDH